MSSRVHVLATLRRLREAGKLPPPRRRLGRMPPRRPPDAVARQYTRAIVDQLCTPARAAFEEIEAEILALLRDHRRELGHADAGPRSLGPALAAASASGKATGERERASVAAGFTSASWRGKKAGELIDVTARRFARKVRPDQLHALAKRFGESTDKHSRAQLDAQLRAAIGVPLSSVEKSQQDKIGEWAAKNVVTLQDVPDRYFDRIQQDVQEAFAGGTHPTTLAAAFADRFDMSQRDAASTARDQVLKLDADLNHSRMAALGVERAIWRTMRDNRVCDECYAKEGKEFSLARGLGGCLPGFCHHQDRCYSDPVLDDFLGPS